MCVAIFPATSLSQWNISYNTGNFNSNAIVVTGADTAMLAGNDYGRIYRTSDGGNSWQAFQTPFNSSWFFDIDFVDQSVGYAAGGTYFGTHTDLLVRTMDGGVTWDSITSNSGLFGYTIDHIDFVDMNTGFLAGHSGLQKTVDGGSSFTPVAHQFEHISEVYFYDENLGFVAETKALPNNHQGYYIWKTLDQGNNWTLVYSDSLHNADGVNHRAIQRIQMLDPNNGYASGGNSTILKTTDGGNSWVRSSIAPHSTNLTGMWFTDINTGYVNNAGGIYKTTDGGQTWQVQTISPTGVIHHIAFADNQDGYAGGTTAIYTTKNGGAPTNINELKNSDLSLFPNPAQNILNIRLEKDEPYGIQIVDMSGRIMFQGSNEKTIDINQLATGTYILKLHTKGQTINKQFVKQ